jgi:hypothetical protein
MAEKRKAAVTPVKEKYRGVMASCRDAAVSYLTTHLTNWFDGIEDALMEASDACTDNRSQLSFIEAIRPIQAERQDITDALIRKVTSGFDQFLAGERIHYPFREKQAEGNLSLMDSGEEEEYLAVRKIADRYQGHWPEEFYGIEQRLAMVRGGRKIEAPDIPGGPTHATFAFQQAVNGLGLESRVYPVLYNLFATTVLRESIELYNQYNALLIAEGIFPNLKYVAKKTPESEAPKQKREEKQQQKAAPQAKQKPKPVRQGDPAENQVVDTISEILNKQRKDDPRFRSHPDVNPFAPPREMVDSETVVGALQNVQPATVAADFLPPADEKGIGKIASIDVNQHHLDNSRWQLSEEKRNFFKEIDQNSVEINDLDAIEMVGMLFERILDEEDLPNVVKALLSYLHTPYLKVGIMDPNFLVDPKHMARKLLNLMVHAGRYWVDETDLRRGIYYPLKRSVDRILGEFHKDLSLFEEVLNELWTKVEQLEKRAAAMEKRSRDAAGGQERLTMARTRARDVLNELLGERPLHPDIRGFFDNVWMERLSFMLLRNPDAETSQQWQDSMTIVQTLMMGFDGREHPDMPERMRGIYPNIRKYVDKAIKSLGDFQRPVADRMFACYDAFLGGNPEALQSKDAKPIARPEAAPAPAASAGQELTDEEQAMVKKLEKLDFGTWFVMADSKGKVRPMKLSWFNPNSRHFMFVDQSGVQAIMIDAAKLAKRLCSEDAKILEKGEDTPFVGRTLRKIRQALQNLTGSNQPNAAYQS